MSESLPDQTRPLCGTCQDRKGAICDMCGNGMVPTDQRRVPFRPPHPVTEWPDAPFTVNPKLVRAILAAVAFLYADAIPEDVYERLNAPSDRMLDSLNRLVEIRVS